MPAYCQNIAILSLASTGMTGTQIAAHLDIPQSTVYWVLKKCKTEHTILRRKQPGSQRPRISTAAQDEAVIAVVRNSPFTSAVHAVITTDFPGHVRTARRRIKCSGLKNHVAVRKTYLRAHHKEARVGFALQHLANANVWEHVIFSDEKIFQSSYSGRLKVYRPRNSNRFAEPYVATKEQGRFAVNIWAWISARSQGIMVNVPPRLTSHVYIRILEDAMLPSVLPIYPNRNFIFQQDNCPIHTAHRVREWFNEHDINVLDWPSNSPDLNPIENMWGLLVRNLHNQRVIFRNTDELLAGITEAWHALPANYHRNLCLSMPRRLEKVLEANGAYTRY